MRYRDDVLRTLKHALDPLIIKVGGNNPDPDNPGFNYPARPADYADNPPQVRPAPAGCETPLWQLLLRPVTPADVGQQHMIPSAFLKVVSGVRSATGGGLQNSPERKAINNLVEDYVVAIQCVFREGYGAHVDGKPDIAKPLLEQINGFVHDIDDLVNAFTLRPMVNRASSDAGRFDVRDAYLATWNVYPALEGTTDELFLGHIVISLTMPRHNAPQGMMGMSSMPNVVD